MQAFLPSGMSKKFIKYTAKQDNLMKYRNWVLITFIKQNINPL